MFILGLTGSIGMGKTTAAKTFRRLGLPVHDADAIVHRLLAGEGPAAAVVAEAFPEAAVDGVIDRRRLAALVFEDDAALKRLEAVLHPLVRQRQNRFLRIASRHRYRLVVLDVPLLFETGGDRLCDAVVVVSAPPFVQAQRVLRRPGMTTERLARIHRRQWPDAVKRARADFVVPTGLGREYSLRCIRRIVAEVGGLPSTHWPPKGRYPQPGLRRHRPFWSRSEG